MDVKYLTYIVEMANQKSITKAANALFVSQPSLSQYLSKLETELGTPLFVRTKNELLPTPAGELYIDAAKNVIRIQKQLYRNISTLSQTGQIRIGISSQWALEVLTDIMPAFQERYPLITIKISQNKYDNLIQLLNNGKLDVALMAATSLDDFPYDYELLREEEVYFSIAKNNPKTRQLTPGNDLSIDDLISIFSSTSFILSDEGSTLRDMIDEVFHLYQFVPLTCCDVNSNNVMQKLVSRNMGVSFIPSSYVGNTTDIYYFRTSPKLFRYNILASRKNTAFSEIDLYLFDLIRQHPLFVKKKLDD